jgi:hypothetical protein
MSIGWRKEKEERQARTTTDECMDPEATQKRARMMSGSVSIGSIRITSSPSQDGSTVNDQITGSDESLPQSFSDREDKERLVRWCSSRMTTFALLGGTRNTRLALLRERQSTSQS